MKNRMKNRMLTRFVKLCVLTMIMFVLAACKDNEAGDKLSADSQEKQLTDSQDEGQLDEAIDSTESSNLADSDSSQEPTGVNEVNEDNLDLDLTSLSSTMVYSEVYNMMCEPDKYIGKTIKMTGPFTIYQNEETGQLYFACVISDATACCQQGIEFELAGDNTYPDDYPEIDDEITVVGVFELYDEEGSQYIRLGSAKLL